MTESIRGASANGQAMRKENISKNTERLAGKNRAPGPQKFTEILL